MLSLEHPHIVRALKCIVHHNPAARAAGAAAGASGRGSEAGSSSALHTSQVRQPAWWWACWTACGLRWEAREGREGGRFVRGRQPVSELSVGAAACMRV